MPLDLLACGFNAHSQLAPAHGDAAASDLRAPTAIASADSLGVLFVGWSDILLKKDGQLHLTGAMSSGQDLILGVPGGSGHVKQAFGDHSGPKGIVSTAGQVFRLVHHADGRPVFEPVDHLSGGVDLVVVAGNGRTCVVRERCRVFAYESVYAFLDQTGHDRLWNIPTSRTVQLVANECSFVILTAEGELYSWGDPRYSLGRDVTEEEPANEPCLVSALEGLRISKLASGGWLTVALSEERDAYIWGSHVGSAAGGRMEFLPDRPGEVALLDLGDGVDVSDVAVGGGHISVLDQHGGVYASGLNANGQVGISLHSGFQASWAKWDKHWQGEVRAVVSGPFAWNTLAIIERAAESTR